jgi:hypothetical protein
MISPMKIFLIELLISGFVVEMWPLSLTPRYMRLSVSRCCEGGSGFIKLPKLCGGTSVVKDAKVVVNLPAF